MSDELGIAILAKLGIDPEHVTGIDIRIRAREIPVITISREVWSNEDTNKLTEVFEYYTAEKKDE